MHRPPSQLILVAEDDPPQRSLLNCWLRQAGYRVQLCANGSEARVFLEQQWADLALLDWDMPEMSGETLLRWIRRRTETQLPVIFQSVHSSICDQTRMLDAGADDFLVKPLDRFLLLSRLRAVLRRYSTLSPEGRSLQLGDISLESGSSKLCTGDRCIPLGSKEFAIAWHLARHAGAVVLRQELLLAVWGLDAAVETRTIDMYVSRLRGRLKMAAVPWQIHPVYGRGYRLALDEARTPDGRQRGDGEHEA